MTVLQQLREALRVVWEVFRRRPWLFSLPVLIVVRIAFREELDKWIREAEEALGHPDPRPTRIYRGDAG
jgi:hypothetical protein